MPLIYSYLPESLEFLIGGGADTQRIQSVLRRIDPKSADNPLGKLDVDPSDRKSSVAGLFQAERACTTLLVWIVFLLNLGEFYALQSWLPPILTNLNYSLDSVALATSLTTVGGIVAAFIVGPAMDRVAPFGSLAVLYLAGALFIGLTGVALSRPEWILMTATFLPDFVSAAAKRASLR